MKKVLFLIGAAALMFAACNRTVEVTSTVNDEICLKSVNSKMKSMVENTTFPSSEDFRVFAYFNENLPAGTAVSGAFGTPFIVDKDYTFDADGIWFGGSKGVHNPYYWPKTGSLVFAGYHGTANVSYIPGDEAQVMSITDYTASYKAKSDDFMNDLMYCPVTAASYNNKGTAAPVEVAFAHALSWVTLKVVANETADGYFRVDSIKINNVNPKGDATITGTQSESTCVWETTGTAATIEQFKGAGSVTPSKADSVVVTKNVQVIGDDYIFIPQALDGITLTVSYSQKTDGVEGGAWLHMTDTVVNLKGLKTVASTPEEITEWASGKHYTYTIAFNFDPTKDEILIQPEVIDWENVTIADIVI